MPSTQRFIPLTSTGLALHSSLEKAIKKGVFEIIERDAALLVWLAKRKVPRLNLRLVTLPKLIFLRDKIFEEGLLVEVCVSTLDIPIPTTIAVLFDPKKRVPFASFGFSAEADLQEAAAKSIEEALLIRNTLEILNKKKRLKRPGGKPIKTFLDHAIFYSFPANQRLWCFLTEGPLLSPRAVNSDYLFREAKYYEGISNVVELLRLSGKEIIYVDVTDTIVRKMGFTAVRVIIPEMQPLEVSTKVRFLGGSRLRKFLRKGRQINSAPHLIA